LYDRLAESVSEAKIAEKVPERAPEIAQGSDAKKADEKMLTQIQFLVGQMT